MAPRLFFDPGPGELGVAGYGLQAPTEIAGGAVQGSTDSGARALGLASYGLSATTELAGGLLQGGAERLKGAYEASGLRVNARLAEINALDAIARGQEEARRLGQASRGLEGGQIASLAAQGIDVGSGAGLAAIEDTGRMMAQDLRTIQNNAWREAYGYRFEAGVLRSKARYSERAGRAQQLISLATGGLKAAKDVAAGYYEYKYPGSKK